jgi:hypothetical protein
MTKKIAKWKTFSFWDKIRMTLSAVCIGGDVTLFIVDSHPEFKIYAAIATGISILITVVFKDENKNNIPDIFEK